MGVTLLALFATCVGCRQDMADQPHFEPLEASDFFADGQAARPLVPGTVARGQLRIDTAFFEGKVDGKPVETYPRQMVAEQLRLSGGDEQVMAQILGRGRERFDIFCAACHDRNGSGQGMVVQRGFPTPPSYHSDRLREAPVGHFYDVITHGFGRMPDYADQIPPADRWAIIAYLRALQLSQHAQVGELPAPDREALQSKGGTP
jgi:mono/diheme cytochrome c family protein